MEHKTNPLSSLSLSLFPYKRQTRQSIAECLVPFLPSLPYFLLPLRIDLSPVPSFRFYPDFYISEKARRVQLEEEHGVHHSTTPRSSFRHYGKASFPSPQKTCEKFEEKGMRVERVFLTKERAGSNLLHFLQPGLFMVRPSSCCHRSQKRLVILSFRERNWVD